MDGRKYLVAGHVIDGSGGPILGKTLVVIHNGMVEAIEPFRTDSVAPELIIDLSHCILLPPLIDSHLHLFMSGTTVREERERQLVADYEELRPVIARHLYDLFSHGVLGFRDGGDRGAFALKYLAEQGGCGYHGMIGRMSGRAWHAKGLYGTLIGRSPDEGQTLLEAYRQDCDQADIVKLVNSGLNSLKKFGFQTPAQFSEQEIAELVKAAARDGSRVMVHANGAEGVQSAVRAGVFSIEHGFFMGRESLELMAEKGTYWVPTLMTMKAYGATADPKENLVDPKVAERNLDHQLEQLALARELGVRVAIGTDAGSTGVLHGESVIEEMKLFVKAGYSLAETVRCATAIGAEVLDIDQFGLLAPGKKATFLVARGTPAQMPRKFGYLEAIYLDGKPCEMYRKNPVKHVVPRQ